MNFVPCVTWVKRGVAQAIPEKVQLSKEELKRLIEESITDIRDLKVENDEEESLTVKVENDEEEYPAIKVENDEEEYPAIKVEIDEEEYPAIKVEIDEDKYPAIKVEIDEDECPVDVKVENDSQEEEMEGEMDAHLVAKYSLDSYEEEKAPPYVHLSQLVEIPDSEGSQEKDISQDDDSEDEENFKIRPEDNLIAVGHVTEDCSTLEVYVYNEDDNDLYVHHDIILPAFPICLEWLSYGPSEDRSSNYLAIGDMTPVIGIWDLDMVDIMEPIGTLGRKLKKKDKKKKNQGTTSSEYGHGDAVLDLSWNKHLGHALASGSADFTTILWDLSTATPVTWLKDHTEKVQCVEWHPFEAQMLLTGSSDKTVLLYDARAIEMKQSWTINEEVEKVVWNHFDPFCFLVGTDGGNIFSFDVRQKVPLYTIDAHAKSISDMSLSSSCPGLLFTTGSFTSLKIWDIRNNLPQLVKTQKLKEGNLLACRSSPDSPFTVAIGGDKKSSNFKVLNTLNLESVRSHFSPEGMESKPVMLDNVELSSESDIASSSQSSILSTRNERLQTSKVFKKTMSKKKWK